MSQIHTKEELLEIAKPLFVQFGVKVMYGVSDGQIFLNPLRAQAHAGKRAVNKLLAEGYTGEEIEVRTKQAEAGKEQEGEPALSVAKLTEKIKEIQDIETLREMMLEETAGQNRVTAIKAIDKRIEEIVELTKNPQ